MDISEIVKQSAVDATNVYAVDHGIEPPILTDKVSDEAIKSYRQNAGPDANAWVELERMAKKAAMADELRYALYLVLDGLGVITKPHDLHGWLNDEDAATVINAFNKSKEDLK